VNQVSALMKTRTSKCRRLPRARLGASEGRSQILRRTNHQEGKVGVDRRDAFGCSVRSKSLPLLRDERDFSSFSPQIFSFLTPRDLVRMSWTNKEFRRVLTSRSTRNIWKGALESVDGLPPCPSHMNEIEYSTVLFHVACHVGPFILIAIPCAFKMG
jgi:hypothetical protein